MLSTVLSAFTVAEIRKKLAFTAMILALYRLGSHVPVPGIDVQAVQDVQENFGGSNILGLLNTFSGGGLGRIALFALGIMPYITASIILQLLTVVVPSLRSCRRRARSASSASRSTRATSPSAWPSRSRSATSSCSARSRGHGLARHPGLRRPARLPDRHLPHTGCILVMWLGELITQRGIGNGISLMIFASIVSGLPQGIQAWWTNPDQVFVVMMPFLGLAVIAAIVFVQEGQRRIPIQYAKRVIGRRMSSGGQTYLPLRVNMAGVIPVIFAASIMAFPPTIASW
jgi:preprotein translocase subunit SecY